MKKIFLIIPIIVAISLLAIPYIIYADSFVMYQNSDAMYPTLFPGDLLIIEKSEISDVVVDDIIAFNTHIEGVDVLVRRVIEASPGDDGKLRQVIDQADSQEICLIYADVDNLRKFTRIQYLEEMESQEESSSRRLEKEIRLEVLRKLEFAPG